MHWCKCVVAGAFPEVGGAHSRMSRSRSCAEVMFGIFSNSNSMSDPRTTCAHDRRAALILT